MNIVPCDRTTAAAAARERASSDQVFYASHTFNPYLFEGTKTFAYEVFEEVGRCPAVVVVAFGGGTLLLGAYLGFQSLLESGAIDRVPALVAVRCGGPRPASKTCRCWSRPTSGPPSRRHRHPRTGTRHAGAARSSSHGRTGGRGDRGANCGGKGTR